MSLRDPLAGHERVAVLGLGASGTGACRLLASMGKEVLAVDGGAARDVDLPAGVEVRWGTHEIGDATAAVLSPSFNPEWPENAAKPDIARLRARGAAGDLAVWSEVVLAAAAFPGKLLSIGGTDGKSTTAAMAHGLLAGSGRDAWLGGNSWRALSDVVLKRPAATHGVVEVSAFQLWEPHSLEPGVALLTNIAADHLDHYASMDDYVRAKCHVHRNLHEASLAVVYAEDPALVAAARALLERGVPIAAYGLERPGDDVPWAARAWRSGEAIVVEDGAGRSQVPLSCLQVPGLHNQKNAAGAWLAARALVRGEATIGPDEAAAAFEAFRGLPHRLAFVRELDGVRYYDDSKATNVHAAATGLRSLSGSLVAIVGGVDKKLDLAPLIEALSPRARHVVVIGEVRERFMEEATPHLRSIEACATLEAAVSAARSVSEPGDSVVLAPGCSSFDMFSGFEARGRAFATAVQSLAPRAR